MGVHHASPLAPAPDAGAARHAPACPPAERLRRQRSPRRQRSVHQYRSGHLGVSRGSPRAARLGALKRRTIGITSPGSASEIYTSYYMRLVGLDPARDAKMVALGGGPSLLAALRQGQIDAFMQSPPT